ncbi:serine/threonine kinase [Ignicoccus pacificus DSM 13166]|uniref:non-specific serine/threonine protein kinase n=1 Tax=Ignicoccus pacificus DSM 13166 TaxID=940294 RepID=A0A977KAQ9_9CREN|nr:serine/threonine kinase [Ignicoccus pacificus DSM 13166]
MNIHEALKVLTPDDIRVLQAIEKYLKQYEFVPIEVLERTTRLPPHRLERSLYKLNSLKLIRRQSAATLGYRLTILAYDVLAVLSLMKRGVIEALGDKLGVGKESDVYLGIAPGGKKLAVKFHRVGRTSFRHVVRHRTYKVEDSWLLQSKVSAQREFAALRELYEVGAKVPKPIDRSRHVVVTELIEGAVELSEKPALNDPLKAFGDVIETIAKAYNDVGIVHGDLSEYNIIVIPETSEAYVIDWPQYVEKDHPSAEKLLRRDVEYVVRFFKKVYGVPAETEEVLRAIKGEVSDSGS